MDNGPIISELENGLVHAGHGPIDLMITIDANEVTRAKALRSLQTTLSGLLAEIVADLDILRRPAEDATNVTSPISKRMVAACAPLSSRGFITSMAAVAGSVADTICESMWDAGMTRLIVNNGGDIAVRMTSESYVTIALADISSGALQGSVRLEAGGPVRGVATSGRGGRSLTMGIADSVTVFAGTAAAADASATFIASQVDLPESPQITRRRACDLDANSDLGMREVVVNVGLLTNDEIHRAIDRGLAEAKTLRDCGLIEAVAMKLGDVTATFGHILPLSSETDRNASLLTGPLNAPSKIAVGSGLAQNG